MSTHKRQNENLSKTRPDKKDMDARTREYHQSQWDAVIGRDAQAVAVRTILAQLEVVRFFQRYRDERDITLDAASCRAALHEVKRDPRYRFWPLFTKAVEDLESSFELGGELSLQRDLLKWLQLGDKVGKNFWDAITSLTHLFFQENLGTNLHASQRQQFINAARDAFPSLLVAFSAEKHGTLEAFIREQLQRVAKSLAR